MRILVLGAGAIGGYFGGRLVEAGTDVTFLVRTNRRHQLERDGLQIDSALGQLRVPVKTVLPHNVRPDYDIILLTCKAYDLDSAMEAIAPAVRDGCPIVPLMNGLAHLSRLDERFGRERVLGGTCQISARLGPDGVIRHLGALQRLVFGERDGSRSARAQAFAGALAKTTIEWELSDDIEQNLWEKIVFLSALAATTCLFRANVGEILAAPGGREAMTRAYAANLEIATREGHPPRSAAIEFARKALGDPGGVWSSSMHHDLEAGGSIEADHIIGWMLDKAREHRIDDTVLSLAYTHVKAYEARRAAGRLPGSRA